MGDAMTRYADEIWLPVPGYETRYEVSDLGRVRSLGLPSADGIRSFPPRILRPGPGNCGHLSVALTRSGTATTHMVHRLVLETHFIGPRRPKDETRHYDGNPQNNRLDNLLWGSRSDNIQDAIRHGTFRKKRPVDYESPAFLKRLVKDRKRFARLRGEA